MSEALQSQATLATFLDRWVEIVRGAGVENPRGEQEPQGAWLSDGQTPEVWFCRPIRSFGDPGSEHSQMLHRNVVMAIQRVNGVDHMLRVTNDEVPYKLFVPQGEIEVVPQTTAEAIAEVCLKGQVVGVVSAY